MSQSPEYIHSELPAIALFKQMGYQYFDGCKHEERDNITEVLLKERLLAAIKRINPWINESNLGKAYNELTTVNGASLMEINQKVWSLIRGGTYSVKQVIAGKEEFKAVHFIDYSNPDNNDFLVVNQIKYHGKYQHSVPDLVVYINGMPIAVIECKSPVALNSWDKAHGDLSYYQENSPKLFHFNQLCVRIWDVDKKYGTINSPQQFYSIFKLSKKNQFKTLNNSPKKQNKLLYTLFHKERLLDIIRHFVLFE